MLSLLCTKFEDWKYEDEVRVVAALNAKDGDHYFRDFDAEIAFREVVFGARCSQDDELALKRALRPYDDSIGIIQARLAFQTFKVVTDQRGPRHTSAVAV